MSISAKDIAEKLQISTSTVSLVLNNKPGVKDETRRKVLEAATGMGYIKKSPKYQQIKKPSIEFVIYKKHGSVVSDTPFFSELTEAVSFQTIKNGFTSNIVYFYPQHNIEEQLFSLNNSESQGILLLATEMDENDIEVFSSINKPMVLLDSYFYSGKFDCVVINNEQGAFLATKHLIDLGHTNIGYLHSSIVINNFKERLDGYFKAVSSRPSTYNSSKNIINVEPTFDGAYKDMYRYLESGAPLPKALFADNDIIATSCIRAMKDFGFKMPKEISIIGFDNMPICEVMRPSLTTIHVPKQRLGFLAVERLMDVIQGKTDEKVKISVTTELLLRESTIPYGQ